jgi:hypothetical protein
MALDELERNTLHAHANAYPSHWDGVLDVDDACRSFYSTAPERCGIDVLLAQGATNGHVTHQPAWSLLSALRLAGVQPDRDGYTIAPSLPLRRFSLRLPQVGIASEPGELRGYVRPAARHSLTLTIRPPGLPADATPSAWVAGRRARVSRATGGGVRLTLPSRVGGGATDWALRWP